MFRYWASELTELRGLILPPATTLQRSWVPRGAPATFPDAATLLILPLQRFCNPPGRCNAPDPASATRMSRTWMLQRS